MGDKSAQKKKLIVERARRVFMEKGYKEVTMKDIVEECDISREDFTFTSRIPEKYLRKYLDVDRRMRMTGLKKAFRSMRRLPRSWHCF